MTDGSVVNNHGDRKSPKDRVVGPLPNGLFMAYKWGLLTGMILQVPHHAIVSSHHQDGRWKKFSGGINDGILVFSDFFASRAGKVGAGKPVIP